MDYALGAILGACVGDATGAVLEFRGAVNTHDVEVWYHYATLCEGSVVSVHLVTQQTTSSIQIQQHTIPQPQNNSISGVTIDL